MISTDDFLRDYWANPKVWNFSSDWIENVSICCSFSSFSCHCIRDHESDRNSGVREKDTDRETGREKDGERQIKRKTKR
jgi:hypothetical protein